MMMILLTMKSFIPPVRTETLRQVVSAAAAANRKLIMSVGGGGDWR